MNYINKKPTLILKILGAKLMKISLTPIKKEALEKRHIKERNANKKDCIKAVLLHDRALDIE